MSLIPPKAAKKPGMPKLSIPSRPSSSTSSIPQVSDVRSSSSGSNGKAGSTGGPPSLSLAMPSTSSQGSSILYPPGQAQGDDECGAYEAGDGGGELGTVYAASQSSYPDTVPRGGPQTDFTTMTNDLRRAIGGMRVSDGDLATMRPGSGSGSHNEANGSEAGTLRKLPVGSTQSNGSSTAASQVNSLPDDLVLEGKLEILGRLGEGASGEVKKARHIPTGLLMAKKTISTSPNPAIHRQILRELSFNRSCHSDHIVRYYGAFLEDEDTSIAICMEYCEAGSLAAIYKRVKSRGGRTGEKILGKISECVLKGLGYLHERKIIHRDIKPSNILVTRQGQIKLCDFGVSGELINSMAGTFTGTSYYMAPERIQGLPYTISSDVWSLGLTILEIACNRFPFPAEGEPPLGPIDLLSYVISMKTPELKDDETAGIKWSKVFRDFIERCLEKDGTRRPGPNRMMTHPFIKKSEARVPQPDLARFVAEVWGWPPPETHTSHSTHTTPTSTDPTSTLNRTFSMRQAPPRPTGPIQPLPSSSSTDTSDPAGKVLSADKGSAKLPPKLSLPAGSGFGHARDLEGRSFEDRAAAKMREADLGLVGSPTEESLEPEFGAAKEQQ